LAPAPREAVPIPDLRQIGDGPPEDLGPDFRDIFRDSVAKQDWYRDHLRQQGAQRLPFVGRFPTNDHALESLQEMYPAARFTPGSQSV
jgi:hypothetical protein